MARDNRGRRGFGHSQDRSEIVADEAALIVDAAHRLLAGETLSAIVDDWNQRGIRTTTGGPWRINALSALLIQPRLVGMDSVNDTIGADSVPAILDRTTHERLLALRRARRKNPTRLGVTTESRRYLLTGFLRCWRCGSRLGGITPRTGTVQPHYRCPSRGAGGCSGAVVHAGHADEAAADAVLVRLNDPEFVRSLESGERALADEGRAMASVVADAIMGRHSKSAGSLWAKGDEIDGQAWERLKEMLEAEARSGRSELSRQTVLVRQRRLYDERESLRRRWSTMSLEEQRSVIDGVVDHFVVLPAPRRRNQFTAERLTPVWRG